MKKEIEDIYINDINSLSNELINFLEICGVPVLNKDISFKELIGKLKKIVAVRKDKKYYGVEVNELGYIESVISIDGILEKTDLPVDITAGYYKYENGNFTLDEKTKLERR